MGRVRNATLWAAATGALVAGLLGPSGLVLDVSGGKMYWSDFMGGDIERANLDGATDHARREKGLEELREERDDERAQPTSPRS